MSDAEIEDLLANEIRPMLTRLELLYTRVSQESSISRAQLSIMSTLADVGPCRISQIAQTESIRMPTASNAIHQLEKLGMVTRVRDVEDRRGVQVKLTDKGHEELNRVGAERNRLFRALFTGLDREQLERAVSAIPIIRDMLENYGKPNAKEAHS
nr:MarR family transcriptional regulator [Corynebacterium ulceribovis]